MRTRAVWLVVVGRTGFMVNHGSRSWLSQILELKGMGAAAGTNFAAGEVGGFSGPALMGILKDVSGGFTAGLLMLTAITMLMQIPTARLHDRRA